MHLPGRYPDITEPTALARRLAQAHYYLELLEPGEYLTITLLAEAHNQDPSKLTKILNLVNLSPAIQKMIVEGNAPKFMTLRKSFMEGFLGIGRSRKKYI